MTYIKHNTHTGTHPAINRLINASRRLYFDCRFCGFVERGGLKELAGMKRGVLNVSINKKGGLSCGSYPPIGIMEVPPWEEDLYHHGRGPYSH